MIETCQSSLNYLERLRLLTNSNNLTRLNRIRSNVEYLSINCDMLMTYELTSGSTSRSNTQTENNVVQTALEKLKENLTGDTLALCSLLKQVAELTLQHTIGVLSLLLLSQLRTILRLLAATVITMLSWREIALCQYLVRTKDGLSETA